jgi:methyl-accepting chemotaxis protein
MDDMTSVKDTVAEAIRNRRRTLFVNPTAQRRFVLSFGLPTLIVLLTVGIWVLWIERNAYEDMGSLPSFLPIGIGLFVGILAFEATIVVQAMRVSHRVEGAAYRLIKAIDRIGGGDLNFTVSLRKGDYLQEVAAELNRMMERLRAQRARDARADEASSSATADTTHARELETAGRS